MSIDLFLVKDVIWTKRKIGGPLSLLQVEKRSFSQMKYESIGLF